MPTLPQTPSPFRFASKARRHDHQPGSSATKPPSSALRHPFNAASPDDRDDTRQFAHTPSFSRGDVQNWQEDAGRPSIDEPLHKHSSTVFRPPTRAAEVIHDGSQETHVDNDAASDHVHYDVAFSPSKRRRLSAPHEEDTGTLSRLDAVRLPAGGFLHNVRQIQLEGNLSTVPSQPSSLTSAHSASARPHFLPQPTQRAAEQMTPLPEAFSPHRRGRKYTPGGMAETMQGWIMEVSHSAQRGLPSTYAAWQSPTGTAPGSVRLKLLDTGQSQGDSRSFHTVTALDVDGSLQSEDAMAEQVLNIVLLAQGPLRSLRHEDPGRGAMVEVRSPYWDIRVGDGMWMIAVDWRLLS